MYLSLKQLVSALLIVVVLVGVFYWLGGKKNGDVEVANIVATSTDQATPAVDDFTALKNITNPSETGNITSSRTSVLSGKLAPEFVRPGGFTNTDPFLLKDLRGKKVVLVMFWSTSVMDSVRSIPYLNDWYAKYHNNGLTIVAIHTPRFVFERSKNTVDAFGASHNMAYPIVIDNGAETWTAYKNKTWPHMYLIDLDGRIVYDHAGDGAYITTEKKILELLNTRAARLKLPAPPDQTLSKIVTNQTDPTKLGSNEAFFGSSRNKNLANGITGKDGIQTFDALTEPKLNFLYLFGGWNISRESAQSLSEHTSIIYRFHAKRVFTIMGAQKILRVRVLLDGKTLDSTNAGKDVRFEKNDSVFYVNREHFYEIVNINDSYSDHTIEFIPESGGLDAYSLAFE